MEDLGMATYAFIVNIILRKGELMKYTPPPCKRIYRGCAVPLTRNIEILLRGGCTVQCGAKSLTVVTNPVGQFPFLLYSSNFHTV